LKEINMRIWTEEARKAQAEAIRRWQPWKASTGPRTEAGKARSAANANKPGGSVKSAIRAVVRSLGRQNRFRLCCAALMQNWEKINPKKRTIMIALLNREGDEVIKDQIDALLHLISFQFEDQPPD